MEVDPRHARDLRVDVLPRTGRQEHLGGLLYRPWKNWPTHRAYRSVAVNAAAARPFAGPEAAVRKLVEIASGIAPAQDVEWGNGALERERLTTRFDGTDRTAA